MDSLNNAFASSDPKAAVMNQVRQEAAMTNARQLIEVNIFSFLILPLLLIPSP